MEKDHTQQTQLGIEAEHQRYKTLGVRLEEELHARLSFIAQLSGSTITDEIRTAIATHVEAKAADQDLAGAAAELLEEIERDAAARREALAGLLGQTSSEETTTPKPARSRGRKGSTGDASATS